MLIRSLEVWSVCGVVQIHDAAGWHEIATLQIVEAYDVVDAKQRVLASFEGYEEVRWHWPDRVTVRPERTQR